MASLATLGSLAASHDALLPRQDNRLGLGAAMALLAHGGLVAALAIGLHWRLPQPDAVVSAELWSAVPQAAAPAAVQAPPPAPPPPTPTVAPAPAPPPGPTPADQAAQRAAERQARDAEIALEKRQAEQRRQDDLAAAERARQKDADEARRLKQRLDAKRQAEEEDARQQQAAKKAEDARRQKDAAQQEKAAQKERDREKAVADAKARADAKAKADAQVQAEQIARQREENLKRMLGQAGATGAATATGTAKADAAPSQAYAGRIKATILPNIVQPERERGNPVTEVEVRCAPDGSIVGRRISKPSGNPAWDETVLRAIDKTRQLPLDSGRIPATMTLVFRQDEAR